MTTFRFLATSAALATVVAAGCDDGTPSSPTQSATLTPLEAVTGVFEAFANNDADALTTLVREDYIQHSAFAADGRQGLLDALPTIAALTAEPHRTLVDGDMVAIHQTYAFPDGSRMVAFDVFRTQDGQVAEHWDALQAEVPASEAASGRSMVDGPTEVTDLDKTEANRALVLGFVEDILTKGEFDKLTDYVSTTQYHQHNPLAADGLDGLGALVEGLAQQGLTFYYTATPLVVAQGNFVLTGSEGVFGPIDNPPYGVFYDLFRVEDGKIVEHWDVIPASPDPAALPHDNGFF